jgi:hypothetical protein
VFRAAGRRAVRQVVIREAFAGSATLLVLARDQLTGINQLLIGLLRRVSRHGANTAAITTSLPLFAIFFRKRSVR